jgi:hypothetical protein
MYRPLAQARILLMAMESFVKEFRGYIELTEKEIPPSASTSTQNTEQVALLKRWIQLVYDLDIEKKIHPTLMKDTIAQLHALS